MGAEGYDEADDAGRPIGLPQNSGTEPAGTKYGITIYACLPGGLRKYNLASGSTVGSVVSGLEIDLSRYEIRLHRGKVHDFDQVLQDGETLQALQIVSSEEQPGIAAFSNSPPFEIEVGIDGSVHRVLVRPGTTLADLIRQLGVDNVHNFRVELKGAQVQNFALEVQPNDVFALLRTSDASMSSASTLDEPPQEPTAAPSGSPGEYYFIHDDCFAPAGFSRGSESPSEELPQETASPARSFTGVTAADAEPPPPPRPTKKQMRQRLMREIGEVIEANRRLQAAKEADVKVAAVYNRLHTVEQRCAVALLTDAAAMLRQLDLRTAQRRLTARARDESQAAHWSAREAAVGLLAALNTLQASIQAVSSSQDGYPDLVTDAAFVTATLVHDRTAMPNINNSTTPFVPETPPTERDLPAVETTASVTVEALSAVAEVFAFSCAFTEAAAKVQSFVKPNIKEPMRDTEEEIQRYLRQLEDFMVQRQRWHLVLANLRKDREHWLPKLADVERRLQHAYECINTAHWESSEVADRARTVHGHIKTVQQQISMQSLNVDDMKLDTISQPEQTALDIKRLGQANKALHGLAVAMARLNEAKAGCTRVTSAPERQVKYTGLAVMKSWEQCANWWSAKEAEERTTAEYQKVRGTRVHLADETKRHFEDGLTRAKVKVMRFLVVTAAQRDWCDDLRAMINAAAWTQADGKVTDRVGLPGCFPQY